MSCFDPKFRKKPTFYTLFFLISNKQLGLNDKLSGLGCADLKQPQKKIKIAK